MFSGTAYGVVLNDREERAALSDAFRAAPYAAPPAAPVMYIKPRNCLAPSGGSVVAPDGVEISVAPTIALLFNRDTTRATPGSALEGVGGMCLALDVSETYASYYRPAIRQRCRDGFLPLGAATGFRPDIGAATLTTLVDGEEVHRWSLTRLARRLEDLVVDVSAFMTLAAGDLLLVGLPGDAPTVRTGQGVEVRCDGLSPLRAAFIVEARS